MGILRTDKISGLETPTPVTASVEFDGSGDYLQTPDSEIFSLGTNDYTIEGWFYFTTLSATQRVFGQRAADASELQMMLETNASGELTYYFSISSSKNVGGVVATKVNTWHHIAVVRKDLVHTLYVDGVSVATNSTDTGSLDNRAQPFSIGRQGDYTSNAFNGHISNFRICKGTAVYTSDFTVPTHALEVTQDTVLLCCNNPDSVTASDHGVVGAAPPTLTANGDPTVSSINPGLTRDFTSGTEFNGVTTFDTQGYFVPPSGTTEQRNLCGTRGLFAGSNPQPADNSGKTIEFITISTTGNTTDFGDRTGNGRRQIAAMSNRTRGVFAGSYSPISNIIDYVSIPTTGNAVDFGDTLTNLTEATGISNSTRGIISGGRTPTVHDVMQYVTIPTLGNATDFGDLTGAKRNAGSFQSSTRGIVAGGRNPGGTSLDVIEYVTIASTGNAVDFGDISSGGGETNMGGSNSTRGLVAGGSPSTNTITYVTIASTGNSQDFGDNTAAVHGMNTMATSPTRACMFGAAAPARTLSYVEIATTGNALDFGSFGIDATTNYSSGCSSGHGGLS